MSNIQKTPLAFAIALALASSQDDAQALYQPVRSPFDTAADQRDRSGFDDSRITIVADDWHGEDDDVIFATELMDDETPFDLEDLDSSSLTRLAAYGDPYAPSKPCAAYGGVVKLSVKAPKGGIVSGDPINCGKSIPAGPYGRVCSAKSCKGYGTAYQLKATPVEGFEFVKWGDACKPAKNNPYCNVVLKKNKKVTAKFRKIKK